MPLDRPLTAADILKTSRSVSKAIKFTEPIITEEDVQRYFGEPVRRVNIQATCDVFVSKRGKVYTVSHRKKTIVDRCHYVLKNGYPSVGLKSPYGKRGRNHRSVYVHRMVLETWLGPCPEGKECAHLDGNRKNCHLDNLSWVSHKENMRHCVQHGTMPKDFQLRINSKLTLEVIRWLKGPEGLALGSTEAGKRFGVSRHIVNHIRAGRNFAWVT